MGFSKTFPRTTDKSVYPKWIEIFLDEKEEKEVELEVRQKNIQLMKECMDDAKHIVQEKRLLENQYILTRIAISLFEKRSSHEIFHKESKAKKKFDKEHNK